MKLTSDHVAVKPIKQAERHVGKLLLPTAATPPFMMWGEVIAVGAGHRGERSKALWPMFVKVGDTVLYPKGAARLSYEHLKVDGVHYDTLVFVQERDMGLVVRDGGVYPLYRRIVGHIVEEPIEEETTDSGLIIPVYLTRKKIDNDSTTFVRVQVDYVGFGQRADDGTLIPNTVEVGDIIVVDKYDAWEYELTDGQAMTGHVILDEDQILAIDEDYTPPAQDDIDRQGDAIRRALKSLGI